MKRWKTGSVRAVVAALAGFAVTLSVRAQAQNRWDVPPGIVQSIGVLSAKGQTGERVVHRFDFDERGKGNIEEVPKFWDLFRPPGFPHYARGGFDFDVGFSAPPSFHLFSEGRNVAYQYTGPDTRIRINSEYRIVGFIKPDRLDHGRACLSAHFLDRSGRILVDTIVRSRWIGGESDTDWVRVELYLPAAPVASHSIGLIAWVVQEPIWRPAPSDPRHIPMRDVFGGAWFDDISIYRLPRAELVTSRPGNILSSNDKQELVVTLADHDDRSLRGKVSIVAADGGLVENHNVEVALHAHADPTRIDVGHLEPGLYHARLDVYAQRTRVLSRSLTFARLGEQLGDPKSSARSFGVVIDPAMRVDPDIERDLLLGQRVHSLKIPVWTGLPDVLPSPARQRAIDRLHQTLLRNNFAVTAVLHGPPATLLQSSDSVAPSLFDLLASTPDGWAPHLSAVAAPQAGIFRWWQIGPDGDPWLLYNGQGKNIAGKVRSALRPFITNPQLAAAVNALAEPPTESDSPDGPGDEIKPFVEQITVDFPPTASKSSLEVVFNSWRRAGFERVAMHIPPLPRQIYSAGETTALERAGKEHSCSTTSACFERASRLAHWAQRLITARHVGAHPVFAPQTWRVRNTITGRAIEPDETFLVLRTLADVIGDAEPGPVLPVAEGVKALSFRNGDSSILAIWASGEGQAPAPLGSESDSFIAQRPTTQTTATSGVRLARFDGPAAYSGLAEFSMSALGQSMPILQRRVPLQLGRATRKIDLWGRTTPLQRDATGRQIVEIGPLPVLIDNVDPMMLDIASSLKVSPQKVESGVEATRLTLDWSYPGKRPLAGRVTLVTPDGWSVTPREFDVRWMPRRIERIPVDIRFNSNEPAGRKTITARVKLTDPEYTIEVPFHVEINLIDFDVWGMAWLDGDTLIVHHSITNRSRETIHFRGAAGVPGHERQHRPFTDLRPGDTQSAMYRFSGVSSLVGRRIMLSLREINDGHRSHNLELTVP